MKTSEALLRTIASAGGEVPAIQFDLWINKLVTAGLLEKVIREDQDIFYYKLTETSKDFLRKKGVEVNE